MRGGTQAASPVGGRVRATSAPSTADGGAHKILDMTLRPTPLSDELFDYLVAQGSSPDAVQAELIAETATLGHEARLQISPDEGTFLTLLTKLMGARTALEVGTFTGYSALAIVRGLAAGGRLTCCDISEEWTRIARRYWDAHAA